MQITKFGQCCLLIEVNGKRILTDPGCFSHTQNNVRDLDIILITHEHADHIHTISLQTILAHNPNAIVITNSSVGKMLSTLSINWELLEGRAMATHAGVPLEAYDGDHVEIYADYGIVQNTGYFIAESIFYPGDAYIQPNKIVPILALPVAGPWCKVADAIRYALAVAPAIAFPVHDWLLNEDGKQLYYSLYKTHLQTNGITFVELHNDETKDFGTINTQSTHSKYTVNSNPVSLAYTPH